MFFLFGTLALAFTLYVGAVAMSRPHHIATPQLRARHSVSAIVIAMTLMAFADGLLQNVDEGVLTVGEQVSSYTVPGKKM
jgi:hypothetical protein